MPDREAAQPGDRPALRLLAGSVSNGHEYVKCQLAKAGIAHERSTVLRPMHYHSCMQRITTTVDPQVYARLEELARRSDASVASLIREAMERYVTEREAALQPEPLPDWVGMLEGPGGDYAARDEEVLRTDWGRELDQHADTDDRPG